MPPYIPSPDERMAEIERRSNDHPFARHNVTAKPRDLTWLEPRDQQERCRMLDRLDAALAGADQMAGALGQTTTDYAGQITALRNAARSERHALLAEMDEKS